MKLYKRENYLKKIRGFYHDTGMIKVITGVRRCGKSCLMHTIAEELVSFGIPSDNIIFIDLNKRGYKSIKTPSQLENVIDSESEAQGLKYLFIDEIQNVEGFETVIEAYREEEEYSIFITGSNSYLLSGELTTQLTGRYISFEMFTLTFDEYLGMKRFYGQETSPSLLKELDSYILEGGFPKALEYPSIKDKRRYVESVVKEIFEKDIKRRAKIRNKDTFGKMQTFLINNFGSTFSVTSMIRELAKQGINVKGETLRRYIDILLDAKILYECRRFDLKSKKSIQGEEKFYLADMSFYFVLNVDNRINYGPVLENIIYQYMRSKDYEVSVGRIGKLECDFLIRNPEMEYSYVQVAMTIMNDKKTEDREYRALEAIRDNYPKYILTRDDLIQHRNGIKHFNIPEFIAEGRLFD